MKKRRGEGVVWKVFTTIIAIIILSSLYSKGVITIVTVNNQRLTVRELLSVLKRSDDANILDTAINEKLVYLEAQKRNIVVSVEEVNTEIEKITKEALENGKTLQQLLNEQDQSLQDLQNMTKFRLTYYKILGEKVHISEDEIDDFLDENSDQLKYTESERKFVEAEIRKILIYKKVSTEYESWIREARAASDIDYFVDFENL